MELIQLLGFCRLLVEEKLDRTEREMHFADFLTFDPDSHAELLLELRAAKSTLDLYLDALSPPPDWVRNDAALMAVGKLMGLGV